MNHIIECTLPCVSIFNKLNLTPSTWERFSGFYTGEIDWRILCQSCNACKFGKKEYSSFDLDEMDNDLDNYFKRFYKKEVCCKKCNQTAIQTSQIWRVPICLIFKKCKSSSLVFPKKYTMYKWTVGPDTGNYLLKYEDESIAFYERQY